MTTLQTEWYLDFEETWSGYGTHSWSLGPIQLTHNSQLSVQDWVDIIQAGFNSAYTATTPTSDSTYAFYTITPHVHLPHASGVPGNQNSFAIRYQIDYDSPSPFRPSSYGDLEDFQILFRDGPNGYMQSSIEAGGITPRGQVDWQNYSDTRAAVIPYTSRAVSVIDDPPLPPHLQIVPFRGVNNRLLLMLNSNTGEYSTRPVVIKDDDTTAISDLYFAQTGDSIPPANVRTAISDPDNPLTIQYRNDDPIDEYEIFRLESKPTSYDDFNTINNPYHTVTGQITAVKESSAGSLIDEVEPNTKYYYCARAIDVHNNFSNPTHVFEAELVDNDGQVYLILNTMLFETDLSGVEAKSGRRYLYIEPSSRNLDIPSLPPSDSGIDDVPNTTAPLYGAVDGGDTCWNKTFKVRLTSKKSNKKIDLNIVFKNTGVINP